jgi:hypothetical protein
MKYFPRVAFQKFLGVSGSVHSCPESGLAAEAAAGAGRPTCRQLGPSLISSYRKIETHIV